MPEMMFCPECNGAGMVRCDHCDGKGRSMEPTVEEFQEELRRLTAEVEAAERRLKALQAESTQ